MDSELVKMCDCPEIQDRWEPKVGDRGQFREDGFIVTKVIADIISITRGWTNDVRRPDELIYIPRIEDVLEWLTENHFTTWEKAMEYVITYWVGTPIKALLKACMHLEHNKKWNGEAWA